MSSPVSERLADEPDRSRRVLASQRVFTGPVFGVVSERVLLDGGDAAPVRRDYVDHPGAVAVVALRGAPGAEELLLIQQYRHPVRARLWEIPAGLLDVDGEDYLDAARRELAEEVDLRAGRWEVLVDYFTSPGGSDESLRIYLARDLTDVPVGARHERTDEERDMPTVWVRLDAAVEAVHAGRIHNPSAVVGVLAADSARRRGWASLRPADAPWMR